VTSTVILVPEESRDVILSYTEYNFYQSYPYRHSHVTSTVILVPEQSRDVTLSYIEFFYLHHTSYCTVSACDIMCDIHKTSFP
jgi:hypothetical protein